MTIWLYSLVGQNTGLSHQRARVQAPLESPILRDGAMVAYLAHNQKVVGSSPTPAPKSKQLRHCVL